MKIDSSIKEKSKITNEEWREWTKTVWSIANVSDKEHPAAFPVEIPHRLIKLFSFWGDTILDPFSGTGTTGVAALNNGRNYIGYDTNKTYCDISKSRLDKIITDDNDPCPTFKIINQSSQSMPDIENDSIGGIITSPPYWNKIDYGECEGNIGKDPHYDSYLEKMADIIKECYRVLIPGRKLSIVVANVNQNTREYGLVTIPIASDLTRIGMEQGFCLINQIIWNKDGTGGRWGSANSQRPIFGSYPYPPNFLFKNVNEYIIILQKPDPKKKNSSAPSFKSLYLHD